MTDEKINLKNIEKEKLLVDYTEELLQKRIELFNMYEVDDTTEFLKNISSAAKYSFFGATLWLSELLKTDPKDHKELGLIETFEKIDLIRQIGEPLGITFGGPDIDSTMSPSYKKISENLHKFNKDITYNGLDYHSIEQTMFPFDEKSSIEKTKINDMYPFMAPEFYGIISINTTELETKLQKVKYFYEKESVYFKPEEENKRLKEQLKYAFSKISKLEKDFKHLQEDNIDEEVD